MHQLLFPRVPFAFHVFVPLSQEFKLYSVDKKTKFSLA